MIENILAWAMLLCGIANKNPLYFIASGTFAIAARIYYIKAESEVKQ